ncbi:hypothetical protein CPC08DRAFT_118304 [Agrocybe pediades]|nr:hypothetical protein CPC08DRAFT_118304 [Agrocybe pediades]
MAWCPLNSVVRNQARDPNASTRVATRDLENDRAQRINHINQPWSSQVPSGLLSCGIYVCIKLCHRVSLCVATLNCRIPRVLACMIERCSVSVEKDFSPTSYTAGLALCGVKDDFLPLSDFFALLGVVLWGIRRLIFFWVEAGCLLTLTTL